MKDHLKIQQAGIKIPLDQVFKGIKIIPSAERLRNVQKKFVTQIIQKFIRDNSLFIFPFLTKNFKNSCLSTAAFF